MSDKVYLGQATMQTVLLQRYVPLLVYGIYTFPVFGGGGGTADLGAIATYSTGGGCILLSAPTIIHNGHLTSRGLPGGGRSWNGDGGGGAWNGTGSAGVWQNGGGAGGNETGSNRGGRGGSGGGAGKIVWLKINR